MSRAEELNELLKELDELEKSMPEEKVQTASTDELIDYFEKVTRIRAKIKNLK